MLLLPTAAHLRIIRDGKHDIFIVFCEPMDTTRPSIEDKHGSNEPANPIC